MKERIVLFTAHSKLIIRCLPFLLSIVLFCFPLNVNASSIYWDGLITADFSQPLLYMKFSRQQVDSTGDLPKTSLVYSANDNVIIDIDSQVTDVYLNGTVRKRVNVQVVKPNEHIVNYGTLNIFSDPIIMNGVYVTTQVLSTTAGGTASFDIIIEFDNYYVKNNVISLPILVNFELNCYSDNTNSAWVPDILYSEISVIEDWYGDVDQYIKLDDVPSIDGYFAEQNSQVINNTTINNDLLQQQIQQDHQDTLNQTNELTNGYQSSLVGSAESDFNVGAGQLTGIEDTLSDSSTQYVDSFTSTGFDDSLLDSIAPSMQYVVTWFTNFWNMGGALTKCFTLCFALYIAFFILRVRS